jgi:hypothetical protein
MSGGGQIAAVQTASSVNLEHNPSGHMRQPIYAFIAVLLLCAAARSSAQQYYSYAVSTAPYTDLENDSLISVIPDTLGYYLSVPFSMEAYGLRFSFADNPPSSLAFVPGLVVLINSEEQRLCSFDAFSADLRLRDSGSSISYTLEGAEGEKLLKIQWKDMALNGNPASDVVNAQLWLSQKDNSFEVHIGHCSVTGTAAYYSYFGPSIGTFLSSVDVKKYYSTFHLIGNPAAPNPETQNAYYPMNSTPKEGMVYRFIYAKPASVATVGTQRSGVVFTPNPTTSGVRIELPDALAATHPTLELYDVMGRDVMRRENVATGDRIPTDGLAAGMYYATLRESGRVHPAGTIVVR